jgi:large subunit ribosomal protein L17
MKHHNKTRNFGRPTNQRLALMRSLARALVLEGAIETTVAKAKELRPYVEKLITNAKKNTVASQRLVAARLGNDQETTAKLHTVIAPRYMERSGGYLRITKMGTASNVDLDSARIEFV